MYVYLSISFIVPVTNDLLSFELLRSYLALRAHLITAAVLSVVGLNSTKDYYLCHKRLIVLNLVCEFSVY